jgi:hypothetical protein
MKEEEGEASSTMDPWSLFFYGIKAPITRQKCRGRLAKFFDFVGLIEGTMEERAKTFTEKGKKQPASLLRSCMQWFKVFTHTKFISRFSSY